jgi:hypothetical protein
MSLNLKQLDFEEIAPPYDYRALKVFILSTIFIVFFAVKNGRVIMCQILFDQCSASSPPHKWVAHKRVMLISGV